MSGALADSKMKKRRETEDYIPVEDKKFFRYREKPFSIELLYLWEAKL